MALNSEFPLLYLVRHGETTPSSSDLYYGRTDAPLSDLGRDQVDRLSQRFAEVSLSHVFTSPLVRAMDTATSIAAPHSLAPIVVPEMIEVDYGAWEGLNRRQVAERFADSYARWQLDPAGVRPDGGESGYDVASRVVPKIWELLSLGRGADAVLVAHNTVNRIIITHFLGVPLMRYRVAVNQAGSAVNVLRLSHDGTVAVLDVNNVSHADA